MLLLLLLFFCTSSLHGQGLFPFTYLYYCTPPILLLLIIIIIIILYLDNSISFSPNEPLCIGEQVEMICYVVPPPPTTFVLDTAYVSFNGSDPPASFANINTNIVLGGIYLNRYSASIDGLGVTSSRPGIRLIIASYIPSDSNTIYGCHGFFANTSISEALVSGMPMGQAS